MKFRAQIVGASSLTVSTLEKTGKECVVRITPQKVQVIMVTDVLNGMQVWSSINNVTIFNNYIVQSLNNNEINIKVRFENFQRALRSCISEGAQSATVKLTKRGDLCLLSFSVVTMRAVIVQEVPIEMLGPVEAAQFNEPHLPDPDVHILLPSLRMLSSVVDKMRKVAKQIGILVNMDGCLSLTVKNEMVDISTHFKGLEHPSIEGRSPIERDENVKAEAVVDIDQFFHVLRSYHIQPTSVICCIIESRSVVLHAIQENMYITYYVPVKNE